MVLPPFEGHLYSIFLTGSFEAFSQPFVIWHHYVVLFWVAIHAALFFSLLLWAGVPYFYFHPVDCPLRARIVQNIEAPSRKISSPCPEQSRIPETTGRYPNGTR